MSGMNDLRKELATQIGQRVFSMNYEQGLDNYQLFKIDGEIIARIHPSTEFEDVLSQLRRVLA